MEDKRVSVVIDLVNLTRAGKIKWEIGASRGQLITVLKGGSSFVLSKSAMGHPVDLPGALPTDGTGLAISPQLANTGLETYRLEIRDSAANIIEVISSENWKWLEGSSRMPDALKHMYDGAIKSFQDVERKLDDILDRLKQL